MHLTLDLDLIILNVACCVVTQDVYLEIVHVTDFDSSSLMITVPWCRKHSFMSVSSLINLLIIFSTNRLVCNSIKPTEILSDSFFFPQQFSFSYTYVISRQAAKSSQRRSSNLVWQFCLDRQNNRTVLFDQTYGTLQERSPQWHLNSLKQCKTPYRGERKKV